MTIQLAPGPVHHRLPSQFGAQLPLARSDIGTREKGQGLLERVTAQQARLFARWAWAALILVDRMTGAG